MRFWFSWSPKTWRINTPPPLCFFHFPSSLLFKGSSVYWLTSNHRNVCRDVPSKSWVQSWKHPRIAATYHRHVARERWILYLGKCCKLSDVKSYYNWDIIWNQFSSLTHWIMVVLLTICCESDVKVSNIRINIFILINCYL